MKKKSIKKLSVKSSGSFEDDNKEDLQNVDRVINILSTGRPAQQIKWWIQSAKEHQGEEDVISWLNMTKTSSRKGITPLDFSIFHCSSGVVSVLLDEGAVPTESSLICAREKLNVLQILLGHRKADGTPSLSDGDLTLWVFNHITRANQHSQTQQEFWPVANVVETELLAREMHGVILLPFAAECSKFLDARKEVTEGRPITLLHRILWSLDLSADGTDVAELSQVVEAGDDRLCLLCLHILLRGETEFLDNVFREMSTILRKLMHTLFHALWNDNIRREASLRNAVAHLLHVKLDEVLVERTKSFKLELLPPYMELYVRLYQTDYLQELKFALVSSASHVILDNQLASRPEDILCILKSTVDVRLTIADKQIYYEMFHYIVQQPALTSTHGFVESWLKYDGEGNTEEFIVVSMGLIDAMTKASADNLCEVFLKTLFQDDSLGEMVGEMTDKKFLHSEAVSTLTGKSLEEQFLSDKFIHKTYRSERSTERMRILWRYVFTKSWPAVIKQLYTARHSMPKSFLTLQRHILFAFKTPKQVRSFYQRHIPVDSRLPAYWAIEQEWQVPFDFGFLVKAALTSSFIFEMMFEMFDLFSDIMVVQDYHSSLAGETREAGLICAKSAKLECMSKIVSQTHLFRVSLTVLLVPPFVETAFSYIRTSGSLYLSHIAGYCCPLAAKLKAKLMIPLAFLIQPFGTKTWFFIAQQRLKWKLEHQGRPYRTAQCKKHVFHDDCTIREAPAHEFTVKSCENILENASLLSSKTRLITGAIECTFMPLIQIFVIFPQLFNDLDLLTCSDFESCMTLLADRWSLIITLLSVVTSVLSMSWQQTKLHFTQSKKAELSGSFVLTSAFFIQTLLQIISRLFAIISASYALIPVTSYLIMPTVDLGLALAFVQFSIFCAVDIFMNSRWDSFKDGMIRNLINGLASIFVLSTREFHDKAVIFWGREKATTNPEPTGAGIELVSIEERQSEVALKFDPHGSLKGEEPTSEKDQLLFSPPPPTSQSVMNQLLTDGVAPTNDTSIPFGSFKALNLVKVIFNLLTVAMAVGCFYIEDDSFPAATVFSSIIVLELISTQIRWTISLFLDPWDNMGGYVWAKIIFFIFVALELGVGMGMLFWFVPKVRWALGFIFALATASVIVMGMQKIVERE